MIKISLENEVGSIQVIDKECKDERWTPMFTSFVNALKGMGYRVPALEKFVDVFVDDDEYFDQEEFIKLIDKYVSNNYQI